MELNRIQAGIRILCSCHRAIRCMRCNLESGRYLRDQIRMAHPADRLTGNICKYLRVLLIDQNLCFAILTDIRTRHIPAQHMHHKLSPIAQAKHRDTKLK